MKNNFCFLTEANYPNYVKRFKDFNLKRYLELDLNIPFYISTNMIGEFSEFENHPLIKVFDINELRKDCVKSYEYEPLPDNPKGIYPAKYPWNLRRFILRKAFQDGFLGLFFLECDTRIKFNLGKEKVLEELNRLYSPKTVKTSSSRFIYKNRHPNQELFFNHNKYIEDLKLNFEEEQYDTLDGTNQIFFSETYNDFEIFFDNWNKITEYGYEKPYGYKTGYLSNLSFIIPMSGFRLIHEDTPFETHHVFEDRY